MTKLLIGALAFISCVLFFAGSVDFKRVFGPTGITMSYEVTVSKAYAGKAHKRRKARRLSRRRTAHRVRRRTRLWSSCTWQDPYYYCNGIYYALVVENGTKVYYVVTP